MVDTHPVEERIRETATVTVHKYDPDAVAAAFPSSMSPDDIDYAIGNGLVPGDVLDKVTPYETVVAENLLMYGGASNLWQCLIGNGTATAAQTLTYFDNANAYIGVGDSSAAAAAGQTDLQAATNKDRRPMSATYPQHTDGTNAAAASIVWKAQWGSTQGNFVWNETGLFNGSSGGRMWNRIVQSFGTKASPAIWTMQIDATLA